MQNKDLNTAQQIAQKFFSKKDTFNIKMLGEGDCNVNYLVEDSKPKIVIKLSKPYREYKAFEEYQKEKWCIKKAQRLGILVPKILDVGKYDSKAYQIQTYIEGTPVANLSVASSLSKDSKLKVWRKLGEYTKKLTLFRQLAGAKI